MNLTAEYMSIDSECQLFRFIHGSYLEEQIERSVFNRRKRKLLGQLEELRMKLSTIFNEFEYYTAIYNIKINELFISTSGVKPHLKLDRKSKGIKTL
jgi:hypothetical protein